MQGIIPKQEGLLERDTVQGFVLFKLVGVHYFPQLN